MFDFCQRRQNFNYIIATEEGLQSEEICQGISPTMDFRCALLKMSMQLRHLPGTRSTSSDMHSRMRIRYDTIEEINVDTLNISCNLKLLE